MAQTAEREQVTAALEPADDYGMDVLPDDQIDPLMDFALSLAGRISTVLVERGQADMTARYREREMKWVRLF